MRYPSYLVHFNRRHDPKTGMFTFGDGDGDGIRNDHANQDTKAYGPKTERKEGRAGNNSNRTSKIGNSVSNGSAKKGTPTGSGKYIKSKSAVSRDDHINPVTGEYNRNKTYVDEAKMTNKQYSNASTTSSMKRSVVTGKVTNRGSSFVNDYSSKTDWDADEQKLSKSDEAKEMMRRQFGYTMVDFTEEDDEEKKKKKKKITQSHWGENYKTA